MLPSIGISDGTASGTTLVGLGNARMAPATNGQSRLTPVGNQMFFAGLSLPAGDELVAVQRYLEVMQARLGERLAWQLDIGPGLERALLPPGLLLTLVENAVAHGVEPLLAGGRIVLDRVVAAA